MASRAARSAGGGRSSRHGRMRAESVVHRQPQHRQLQTTACRHDQERSARSHGITARRRALLQTGLLVLLHRTGVGRRPHHRGGMHAAHFRGRKTGGMGPRIPCPLPLGTQERGSGNQTLKTAQLPSPKLRESELRIPVFLRESAPPTPKTRRTAQATPKAAAAEEEDPNTLRQDTTIAESRFPVPTCSRNGGRPYRRGPRRETREGDRSS